MTYAIEILTAEIYRLLRERQEEAEKFLETKEFIETGRAETYVQQSNSTRDLEEAIEILEEYDEQ